MKLFNQKISVIAILILNLACRHSTSKPYSKEFPSEPVKITIFYTNDEHGFIESDTRQSGAAEMYALWQSHEPDLSADHVLILSGGDNWSGPAISTWFKGRSMVEVMNAMGYDASAIGNHEFDFSVDELKNRINEADFTYISANIRCKEEGITPDFAAPYIIRETAGIKTAVIGLTTTSTPFTAFPDYVKNYNFIPYNDALDKAVPAARAEGARLIIIAGHLPSEDLFDLALKANEYGIPVIFGGHDHRITNTRQSGVVLVQAGAGMRNFAMVNIEFDAGADTIMQISSHIYENKNGTPDPLVQSIVNNWRSKTDSELSHIIGYASEEINRFSAPMGNMITDSWLWKFPDADAAFINPGGIRQNIPAGDITLASLVGVLPFENKIIQIRLTGNEIEASAVNLLTGGLKKKGNAVMHMDGSPIKADSVYTVLTIDYLYSRSDYPFSIYDDSPYITETHYRQPVIEWIESRGSSPSNPLNVYLDYTKRN